MYVDVWFLGVIFGIFGIIDVVMNLLNCVEDVIDGVELMIWNDNCIDYLVFLGDVDQGFCFEGLNIVDYSVVIFEV